VFSYVINGFIATCVHYFFLWLQVETLHLHCFACANFFAALLGVCASFLGNKFFVFKGSETSFQRQLTSFFILYGFLAIVHSFIVFLFVDIVGFNYNYGFLVATLMQFIFSYWGNKKIVFKY